MEYKVKAWSIAESQASIQIQDTEIKFGIVPKVNLALANPAELLLGSLSACILKNVERFSDLMNFQYTRAEIEVRGIRQDKPAKMKSIEYKLDIFSSDKTININLLKKNIENYGTIYNTLKEVCLITGDIQLIFD